MKIFLDSPPPSLFKLHHREAYTAVTERIFSTVKITEIFLSGILKNKFTSAIWKKVRTKEITRSAAQTTLYLFESNFGKNIFIAIVSIM